MGLSSASCECVSFRAVASSSKLVGYADFRLDLCGTPLALSGCPVFKEGSSYSVTMPSIPFKTKGNGDTRYSTPVRFVEADDYKCFCDMAAAALSSFVAIVVQAPLAAVGS